MARRRMERIAHNESVFRALNESLEASLHRGRPDGDRAGFICECGDPACDLSVLLPVGQVAAAPALAPDHRDPPTSERQP